MSRRALWCCLLALAGPAWAQGKGPAGLCRHAFPAGPPAQADAAELPLRLTGERARIKGQTYLVEGAVEARQGHRMLTSRRLRYDQARGLAEAEGAVRLVDGPLVVEGERARLELGTGRGVAEQARYSYASQHAHGTARRLVREGQRLRLEGATYTTCDPGREHWSLRARTVVLDQARQTGTARHLVLRAARLPVLYLPYLSFPLSDQRKTGFLPPRIGRTNQAGTDLALPFYWNLAPNYDATLTPRLIQKRGLMGQAEFRYLLRRSRGELRAEYLPGDELYGKDRYRLRLEHRARPAPGWEARLDYALVSDADYLQELGGSLAAAATPFLPRLAELRRRGPAWSLALRARGYQTLNPDLPPGARPYQRLPELELAWRGEAPLAAEARLGLEAVRFARPDTLQGWRLHLAPSLAWPRRTPGWFLVPRVTLDLTRYRLTGQAPGAASRLTRVVPLLSLDAGLFLERPYRGGRWLHTLEPRLFLLHAPFRDQAGFPVFDTGLYDLQLATLLRENRFTGADRVGDARQAAAVLTSRLLDREGTTWARVALGRLFYFQPRRVTLPGRAPETDRDSPLLAEAELLPRGPLGAGGDLTWDPDTGQVEKGGLRASLRRGPERLLHLGFRHRRNRIRQAEVSFLWRLGPSWRVVGRWAWSLRDRRLLEALAGVRRESCCWSLELLWRSYLRAGSGEANRELYLQLELRGLGGLGRRTGPLLRRAILGYPG